MIRRGAQTREDSGVSIVTGFILNLGIATVAISLLLLLVAEPFTTVVESTRQNQLEVTSETLTAEFERADRLAQRGMEGNVSLEQPNVEYTATVDDSELRIQSDNVEVTSEYEVRTDPPDETEFTPRDDVQIRMEGDDGIEVVVNR